MLDILVVAGAVGVIRWAQARRSARYVPLAAGASGAVAFVIVRNHFGLEDSEFVLALILSCSLAAVTAAAASLWIGQGRRVSSIYAAAAVGLVPVFFGVHLVLLFTTCLLVGCDMA